MLQSQIWVSMVKNSGSEILMQSSSSKIFFLAVKRPAMTNAIAIRWSPNDLIFACWSLVVGLIINPPFKIDAYAVAACKGVVVIPCP